MSPTTNRDSTVDDLPGEVHRYAPRRVADELQGNQVLQTRGGKISGVQMRPQNEVGPTGFEPVTKGLCVPTTAFAASFEFGVWTIPSLYVSAVWSLHLPTPNDEWSSSVASLARD